MPEPVSAGERSYLDGLETETLENQLKTLHSQMEKLSRDYQELLEEIGRVEGLDNRPWIIQEARAMLVTLNKSIDTSKQSLSKEHADKKYFNE